MLFATYDITPPHIRYTTKEQQIGSDFFVHQNISTPDRAAHIEDGMVRIDHTYCHDSFECREAYESNYHKQLNIFFHLLDYYHQYRNHPQYEDWKTAYIQTEEQRLQEYQS